MLSHCGCEGSNCEYDPNEIVFVDAKRIPQFTAEECIPPSLDYTNTAIFLYYYYFDVNSLSNAIFGCLNRIANGCATQPC